MNSLHLINLVPFIPIFIGCFVLAIGFAHEMTDRGE
jgi:hypothetical protein